MAAFATLIAAETRAKAQIVAGTWINAYAARNVDGTLCVQVQRPMSSASDAARAYGGWTEITDDSTD